MDQPVTIAIARAGTFTDSRGVSHTFTVARLDEIARSYDPGQLEAPLVFGHPEDNQPALGWVKSLYRQGERLFARLVQVPDEVRKLVHNGHYKYVSMSLLPGGKRLRHVGLLGAVPPAISGLGAVEMSNCGEALTLNFSASELEAQGVNMDDLQKRIGALEEQVKSLVGQVQSLTAERDKAKNEADEALKDKATAESAAATTAAEFAAFKGEVSKATRVARLERLVKEGKVTPGESKDLLAQAEALALIPQPVEFSDGKKEAPEERFWLSLEARSINPMLTIASPPADFARNVNAAGGTIRPPDLSRKI